jgi:cytochrome d ubiquinol oxidase subunit I
MRTSDSMSPIGLPGVATSLVFFIVVYTIVFGAGTSFILAMMGRPPRPHEPGPPADLPTRAAGIVPGIAGAAPQDSGAAPAPAE